MTNISVLLCFIILIAFGFVDCHVANERVGIYELRKGNFSAKFTNLDASLVSLIGLLNGSLPFGAIVGWFANRIRGAQFTLNRVNYKLVANEGNNTLHGGSRGFSHVVWRVCAHRKEGAVPYIQFSYRSFDGEQGFPDDTMRVKMIAIALNKPTPVNLAQHTYWNLGGHNSGDILSHEIQIFGSHITPIDRQLIPTGQIVPVCGTPYDFLKPHTIGSRIKKLPNGYDINYVLDDGLKSGKGSTVKRAAVVHHTKSGRILELSTNAPGMQFYTSNWVKDVKGKGGYIYKPHAGLCLETQGFPNAVNQPNFPSQIVRKGKPYTHSMRYYFNLIN
ncbi:aldose 1-epimerase [Fagus crenata]